MTSDPYPKSRQLARGERRYRRKVASTKQWQAIIEAKRGPCRCCNYPLHDGRQVIPVAQFHHVVPRSRGGDDVADNIVPLCAECHFDVTTRRPKSLVLLAKSLSAAERAYVVSRLGEDGPRRLFGV